MTYDQGTVVPPKTIALHDIKCSIDPRAFERSLLRGVLYVMRDLAQIVVAYITVEALIAVVQVGLGEGTFARAVVTLIWLTYGFVQGLNFTALWVMAHECGHQAFSAHRSINDAVGYVLHSALLVPYHSWRISHAAHHKNTNHLHKDTVYVPSIRSCTEAREEPLEAPLMSAVGIVGMLLLGWPLYLFANVSGQKYDQRANHFEPWSPIFRGCHRESIVLSDVGVAAAAIGLVGAIVRYGWVTVACHYLMPYLWLNAWLIGITYLQHSDARLPHYGAEEWTFVRGALATVDRDWGPLLNGWLHHIHDTHVVHHLFSTMPFYNAVSVTRSLPRIVGECYLRDKSGILAALWNSWRHCRFVVLKDGVAYFRH